MHEESLKSYSQKDLNNLLERGVHIPDLNLVHITRDVQLENIAPGSTIYPFVRITGSKTQIHSGARIGVRGPVILENSFIGENYFHPIVDLKASRERALSAFSQIKKNK